MRILITGACGSLGRAVQRVAAGEHEFVLLDSSSHVERAGGIRASITDRDRVHRAAEGCDAIIHTAAMHGASRGKESNARFIETNVVGSENLFGAAMKHGVKRLVIASTMEVMIGRDWSAYGTAVIDESLPPRPDWIYPVTKRQVELLGSFYARHHGLEVVQLRYMAFSDDPVSSLGMLLLARYITSDDAAGAALLGATRAGLCDEIIHIGPETPLTQRDVNEAMSDSAVVLERYWPGSMDVLRRHRVSPSSLDFWPVTRIDRARQALDWRPRSTFESYLVSRGWSRR